MKTERPKLGPMSVWVVLCMILFMVAASPYAWARGPISPLPGGQKEKRLVTIGEKSQDYNYIFVGERRFKVSTSAVILDYRGKKLTLRDIYVPCKAYITYELFGDTRDPMVHQIQLR